MIKKMAKILLPWFILAYLPNLSSNVVSIYAGGVLGVNALTSLGTGTTVSRLPLSIFVILSLLGLVISAIMQEKGKGKAGRGLHIGFTCAAMGLLLIYYTTVILFPNQFLMMYSPLPEIIDMSAAYLRITGLTVILLMTAFMLIGQLIMKKPSPVVTLIIAGGLLVHMWIAILIFYLFAIGVVYLGIIEGLQIAVRFILPFALIPMRSYWRTFGPEEDIIPAAEAIKTAEAAAE